MKRLKYLMKNTTMSIVAISMAMLFFLGCKNNVKGEEASYRVMFETRGGSAVPDQNVKDGEKITKPADPEKDNCMFDAWYKEIGLVNPWDFDNDLVTANLILFAGWSDVYVVTFETNGGNEVAPQILKDGEYVTTPVDPEKNECSAFGGWYREATFENLWNFRADAVTENITLYAKWENVCTDYNILFFGAIADGKTDNTEAIQTTIDHCRDEGGGRVIVPKGGVFITKTIRLRNNVTLHVEAGAYLKANTAGYYSGLITGNGLNNIGITGSGVIDGSGKTWYDGFETFKPGHIGNMITLDGCNNVNVEDIHLHYSPMWTLHMSGCTDITISGIKIRNPLDGGNTDGIDMTACKNVHISKCDIYTQDDAIVIKAGNASNQLNENIMVEDCILTSRYNAFKIGTETCGSFRNITFKNSTIRTALATDSLAASANSRNAPIWSTSGIALMSVDGGTVEDVTVDNITMGSVRAPIYIRLANRLRCPGATMPGVVKNIKISNIKQTGTTFWASSITGIPGSYIENVTLENLNLSIGRGTGNIPGQLTVGPFPDDPDIVVPTHEGNFYPDAQIINNLPASGFFVRQVKGLEMKNVNITMVQNDQRPVMIFDDVQDLEVNTFKTDNRNTGHSAIRLTGVDDANFVNLTLSTAPTYDFCLRGTNSGITYPSSSSVHNH